MITKYKQNDIMYLVRGTAFAKCVIDEIIIHYTQKENIIKYIVRPYGSKDYVTLDENELVKTVEEAKKIILTRLEDNYINSIESVKLITNDTFDALENKYQKSLIQK